MRDQHIETIRAAVIKANPTDQRWHVICADEEKVRLSDVLLAIVETEHRMICDASRQFKGMANVFPAPDAVRVLIPEPTYCRWNLRKDDLTEQSDETIKFIAELLK